MAKSKKQTTPSKNPAAVSLGRLGGNKLFKARGAEYFRKLQAKRDSFRGGRHKK